MKKPFLSRFVPSNRIGKWAMALSVVVAGFSSQAAMAEHNDDGDLAAGIVAGLLVGYALVEASDHDHRSQVKYVHYDNHSRPHHDKWRSHYVKEYTKEHHHQHRHDRYCKHDKHNYRFGHEDHGYHRGYEKHKHHNAYRDEHRGKHKGHHKDHHKDQRWSDERDRRDKHHNRHDRHDNGQHRGKDRNHNGEWVMNQGNATRAGHHW